MKGYRDERMLVPIPPIKKWQRAWKVRLIHNVNPEWTDLFDGSNGCILSLPGDAGRFRD